MPPRLFRFVVANAMTVVLYASLTGSLFILPFVLIYTYGYSAAAAGAAFLPFSAIMAAGSRTAGGLAHRIGSRAMLAAGSLVTASRLPPCSHCPPSGPSTGSGSCLALC